MSFLLAGVLTIEIPRILTGLQALVRGDVHPPAPRFFGRGRHNLLEVGLEQATRTSAMILELGGFIDHFTNFSDIHWKTSLGIFRQPHVIQ